MKKWLVIGIALFLAACIDVDDFGAGWDKAYIDPALAGTWRKAEGEEGSGKGAREWTFTVKGDAYSVQSAKNGQPDADGPTYPVKTIDIGPYHFLANGPEKGPMVRYMVSGNTVSWYELDDQNAWTFFKKNYPDVDGIYKEEPEDSEDWDNLKNAPWRIATLNKDVMNALAHIPDNEIYWHQDTDLEKVK